jgi:hypothetical protein
MIMKSILAVGFVMICGQNISFSQSLGLPTSISANSGSTSGQPDRWGRPAPDSRGWTDPALNHNNLLIGEGKYQLVGPYKVKGSSYFLGQRHKANLFSATEKAWNVFISYNTYNQEVEFYSTSNPDMPLVKEPGTLDSFVLLENSIAGITTPLKFVYGSHLGTKDKVYYLEVCTGPRFTLYKRYKADLDYDGTNLGQTELRVFEMKFEYFYVDNEVKGIKKLKANASNIIKEFKSIMDLTPVVNVEEFSTDPEGGMCKAIEALNKTSKGF